MDTNLPQNTQPAKQTFDVTHSERELSYLLEIGLLFEIIEPVNDQGFVRIRITISSNYDMTCYGIAMGKCAYHRGMNDAKSIYSPSMKAA